jgi:hypothetical protein
MPRARAGHRQAARTTTPSTTPTRKKRESHGEEGREEGRRLTPATNLSMTTTATPRREHGSGGGDDFGEGERARGRGAMGCGFWGDVGGGWGRGTESRTRRDDGRGGPCGGGLRGGPRWSGGARWRLGQCLHAARVGGRGAPRQVGQVGRERKWAGVGRRAEVGWQGDDLVEGKAGPFPFLSYFFIFCSFLFFPPFQIEFPIKRMLHKITHPTK